MNNIRSFLKQAIVEENRSPGNEVEKIHYLNESSALLPNLLHAKKTIGLINLPQEKILFCQTNISSDITKRSKSSFIFMTMLSFKKAESTTIRETPTNEVVVGLILDAVNIVLLCFQFELRMGVHAASTNKKIFEMHKFWYFFRKVNFILIFF